MRARYCLLGMLAVDMAFQPTPQASFVSWTIYETDTWRTMARFYETQSTPKVQASPPSCKRSGSSLPHAANTTKVLTSAKHLLLYLHPPLSLVLGTPYLCYACHLLQRYPYLLPAWLASLSVFQYHCRSRSSSTSCSTSSPRFSCFSAPRFGSRIFLYPIQRNSYSSSQLQLASLFHSTTFRSSIPYCPLQRSKLPPNVQRLNRISSIVVASHRILSFASSSAIAANFQYCSKLHVFNATRTSWQLKFPISHDRHSAISPSIQAFVPRYSEV